MHPSNLSGHWKEFSARIQLSRSRSKRGLKLDHCKINVVSYQHVDNFWLVSFPSPAYEELMRFCVMAYGLLDTKHQVVFPLNTQEEYDNFMAVVESLELEVVRHTG